MLSRARKLRSQEVVAVLKMGRGLPPQRFISAKILYLKEKPGGTMRIAAVISKKVAKTAVIRNRARRALYDAFAGIIGKNLSQYPVAHIVFFIRALPASEIKAAFEADMERIVLPLLSKS